MPVEKVGYYTDLIADHAVDYIGEQHKKEPFFLSLHFTAPHWPWQGPKDEASAAEIKDFFHYDGGSRDTYAAMMTSLDNAIGRVLKKLESSGIAKNTIVIFTSDNGGERFSDNSPFIGQKTELLEGGIRVPAIIRWPAAIKAGAVTSQVSMTMDWLPTLLAAAGTEPDSDYPTDGENLLPIILSADAPHPRTLFWRFQTNNQRAIRSGDWKYLKILDNEFLFNLANDPRERANLAEKEAEVFRSLKQKWEIWNDSMLPVANEIRTRTIKGKEQADRYP